MNRLIPGKLYQIVNPNNTRRPRTEMIDCHAKWYTIYEHDVVLVVEARERGDPDDSYMLLVGETLGELYIDEFSYDLEWVEVKEME